MFFLFAAALKVLRGGRKMLKTTALLALLTGLLVAVGGLYGGNSGMIIMFAISLAMNFFSYWFSDRIVLKLYGAREVTAEQAPDLVRLVGELARSAKMPMPRVYIVDAAVPNAFATGRNPEHGVVAVTTGIMNALGRDELRGVLAHELAHIKNRDTLISTVVATVAGVITMIANMAQWAAIFGGGRDRDENGNGGIVGMLFLVILAPLAATLIQLSISRAREFQADEAGGMLAGDPRSLARALQKIEHYAQAAPLPAASPATSHMFIINPLSGAGGWVVGLFSTHPATAQRVARLEELAKRLQR
jgi:heat shock protein HtpX